MAAIVLDGIRRMFFEEEDVMYYITLMNENYEMPPLPMQQDASGRNVSDAICKGIYQLATRDLGKKSPKVQLFGSGAILREVLRAQDILDQQFGVSSTIYSVTSYKALYDEGNACERWNRLHPGEMRRPFVGQAVDADGGPIVAASDYVKAVPLSLARWLPAPYSVLGTDGFGRSEAREELRRFFEVDAENVALAALTELADQDKYPREKLAAAIQKLGLDPEKPNQVEV
jgi:pyruvate dehydrogenase E1 component